MITDAQSAYLSHAVYGGADDFSNAAGLLGAHAAQYFSEEDHGLCCAFALKLDENLLTFCGTQPALFNDWLMDLLAYPNLFKHPSFGPVNPGAFIGLQDMMSKVVPQLNPKVPTTIGGHSEGGTRSVQAAAIMKLWGTDPAMLRIVDVAGPCPGGKQLLDYIAPIKKVLYRNAEGPEGDLIPFWPQPLSTYLVTNLPKTHVTETPGNWIKDADPILWHSSLLYWNAISAFEARTHL